MGGQMHMAAPFSTTVWRCMFVPATMIVLSRHGPARLPSHASHYLKCPRRRTALLLLGL